MPENADCDAPQQPTNYPRFYGIPTEAKEYDEFKERVRAFLVRAEGDDTLQNLWALYLWNALAEIEKLRALIDGSSGVDSSQNEGTPVTTDPYAECRSSYLHEAHPVDADATLYDGWCRDHAIALARHKVEQGQLGGLAKALLDALDEVHLNDG